MEVEVEMEATEGEGQAYVLAGSRCGARREEPGTRRNGPREA